MLGVANLPPPSAPSLFRKSATTNNPIFSLLSQHNAHKTHLSILPKTTPNYFPYLMGRNGYFLFAEKSQKKSSFGGLEVEKEEEFDENEDGFGFGFEDEDEDEDDIFVPLHEMKVWLEKKPQGFGEGKVYDTSIEDKLLEEIEQSQKAQLVNVNKLKNESKEPFSKIDPNKVFKVSEGVSSEFRVRINNLPKKKNVHRDLKPAFEGVHGIVKISPAVYGNKKTRDPICKGYAFVDFKSLKDANRFVQMFSGKNITFGNIEKSIKCEILKSGDTGQEDLVQNGHKITSESRFTNSEDESDGYKITSESRSIVSEDEGDQTPDVEQIDLVWEDDDYDEEFDDDEDDDKVFNVDIPNFSESMATLEERQKNIERLEKRLLARFAAEGFEEEIEPVKKNKSAPKKKKTKATPKSNIPASANRLKVREKAKLADVFSRYGSKEASSSKQK